MVKNLVLIIFFVFTCSLAAHGQSFLSEIRLVEPIVEDVSADTHTNESLDTSTDVHNQLYDTVEHAEALIEEQFDPSADQIIFDEDIAPAGVDKSLPLGLNYTTPDLSAEVQDPTDDPIGLSQLTDTIEQLQGITEKQPDVSTDIIIAETGINPYESIIPLPPDSELKNPEKEKDIIDAIIAFIQDDSGVVEPMSDRFTPVFGFPIQTTSIETELNHGSLSKVELLIENEEYNLALEYLKKLPDRPQIEDKDIAFSILERRQYLLIKSYYQLADFEQAKTLGRDYIQNFGNGDHFYRTYYYFSTALFELNEPIEYTSLITDDFFNELSSRESHNLRRILIQDAINKNDTIFAFDFLIDVDSNLIANYEDWLNQIVDKIEKVQDIDAILDRNIHYSIKSLLYLKKIQLLIRDGQYQAAEDFLQVLFAKEELDENTFTQLEELRDYVTVALNTKPHKIGVVLPIEHKGLLGRLSQEVIDGLELAIQEFNVDGNPIELVFKNSYIQFKPDDSLRIKRNKTRDRIETCIRELVEEDKVIAIVGPITRASSLIAGEVAEKYKIPVISLSQTESIGEQLPFLFRYYRKQTHEAAAIAKYATDYLNARRFVIFYPAGKTDKQIKTVEAFEKVVKERNGQIVGSVRINNKQVDFQEGFLSFTGGLKPLTEEEKAEMEKTRERFQAEIDFDAVFIQGSLESVMIISSFLHLYGANHAWILSGSDINVRKNKLLKYTHKLRFVDAFPVSSTSTFLQTFYESHWRNFNFRRSYQPPTAYSIFAFEAIELLSKLLNDPSFHNRESLRNAVQNLNEFPVLTGKVTTGPDGDLIKDLKILKIEREKTVEVFPTEVD